MAHELSPTTLKILNILNDCEVHTGSDMAEYLGISRTAVWKVIQRLKQYNCDIKSQHQGYVLGAPLIPFDRNKIEDFIESSNVSLEIFESVSSTNDYLKNKVSLQNIQGCLAEYQSKGRGRMGRSWVSPFGRNIYCSLGYVLHKDISELSGLSLVVGILIARALELLDQRIKPLLKWPNDIYLNNKKAGGILIDIIAEANGSCRVILGIGLNINMKDIELEDVEKPWISLEDILGVKLDRNLVVAQLINSIVKGMEDFVEKGIEPFLEQWKRYDLLENRHISLSTGVETLSGMGKGISQQGYLLLELPSGEVRKISSGDTTLLKT